MSEKRPRRSNLTEAEKRQFVLVYRTNGRNARDAAIAIGLSPKSARELGPRLMQDSFVEELLVRLDAEDAAAIAAKEPELELTAQRVLRETMCVAYSDMRELLNENGTIKPPDQWSDVAAAAVSSYEVTGTGAVKLKFWSKPTGLQLLGEHLKLWTGAVEKQLERMNAEAKARRAAQLIAAALDRARAGAAQPVRPGVPA